MEKTLLALGIICLVASAAPAETQPFLYEGAAPWVVGKDSFLHTGGVFNTSGGSKANYRWNQHSFCGVWYGDWTNADKDAVAAIMAQDAATVTGVPAAVGWELRFEYTISQRSDVTGQRVFVWKARTDLPEMVDDLQGGLVADTSLYGNNTWAEYGWPSHDDHGSCNSSPNFDGDPLVYDFDTPTWPQWKQFDGTLVDYLLDMFYFNPQTVDYVGPTAAATALLPWDGTGVIESAYAHLNATEYPPPTELGDHYFPLDATTVAWLLDTSENNYVQGLMMNEAGSASGELEPIGLAKENPIDRPPKLVLYYLANVLDGDADGDGNVDLDDMIVVAQNWGTGTTWAVGDFDGDGDVDKDDLELLARNWTGVIAPPAGLVPEPTTIALLGLGALGVFARRRRR